MNKEAIIYKPKEFQSFSSALLVNTFAFHISKSLIPKPTFPFLTRSVIHNSISFALFERFKQRNSISISENLVIAAACHATPSIIATKMVESLLELKIHDQHNRYFMKLLKNSMFGALYFGVYESLKQFCDPLRPLTIEKRIAYATTSSIFAVSFNHMFETALEKRGLETLWERSGDLEEKKLYIVRKNKLFVGRFILANTLALLLFDFLSQKFAN